MANTTTGPARIDSAAEAYLSTFQGEWGVKASTEDALLSVLVALYPGEYPESSAATIGKLRADERLKGLADLTYEWECESLEAHEIAERLVPELDARMEGTLVTWARPRLPTGQVRAVANKAGAMKLYVPAAIARLVTQGTVFQPELTEDGILYRYVEGQAPVALPRWMGGDE